MNGCKTISPNTPWAYEMVLMMPFNFLYSGVLTSWSLADSGATPFPKVSWFLEVVSDLSLGTFHMQTNQSRAHTHHHYQCLTFKATLPAPWSPQELGTTVKPPQRPLVMFFQVLLPPKPPWYPPAWRARLLFLGSCEDRNLFFSWLSFLCLYILLD